MKNLNEPQAGTPKKLPWQIGIHAFLAAILVPVLLLVLPACLYVLINLDDIDSIADTTGESYLPSFMVRQRTLLNIEHLRRYAEIIYTAENSLIRRTSSINALALASESVFEFDSGFTEYAPTALALIRSLTDARNRSEQAGQNLHNAELLFRDEATRLSLALNLPALPHFQHSATHGTSSRERLMYESYRSDTQLAMQPMLEACQQAKDAPQPLGEIASICTSMNEQWAKMDRAWNDRAAADVDARTMWKQLDEVLGKLSDSAYTAESVLTYQAIQAIQDDVSGTRRALLLIVALLLILSLLMVVSIHRYILSPVALAVRNLQSIRLGKETESPPPVRIRELRSLLNQLPNISRHLRELNQRSGQLAEEKDRYESLSYVDALTGISNRRSFDQQLAKESHTASLSVLMIDVDMFKLYNDTLGHQAGDNALIAVAHAMQQALLRSTDRVFRYGGEEFAVILSDAAEEAAMAVAARILITIRNLNIPHPASKVAPILTVSIGVATRNPGEEISDDDLVARADQALYRAKSTGRNRISVYQRNGAGKNASIPASEAFGLLEKKKPD